MIRNKITLKQIEALVYVADLGTFRKAAAALGTTQPNISVRIAAMEDTLKVVLMHRDAGAVSLTEKGAEILTAARAILQSTEVLLDVAGRRDLVEEKLRLGVTELVASTWLQDFLRALKQSYPAMRVELVVDLSREIKKQMSAGEIDLALLNGPIENRAFRTMSIGNYRYGWVSTGEIGKRLGQSRDLASLFAQGMMTHGKQTLASKSLREELTKQGLPLESLAHSSSLTALLHMAADGMGVALLPRQLYKEHVKAGRLVEVECDWEPEPLAFLSCYDASRSALYVEAAASLAVEVAARRRQ